MSGQMTVKRGAVAKPRVSLMLISDLGLDRPYLWATPEIAKARRAAVAF